MNPFLQNIIMGGLNYWNLCLTLLVHVNSGCTITGQIAAVYIWNMKTTLQEYVGYVRPYILLLIFLSITYSKIMDFVFFFTLFLSKVFMWKKVKWKNWSNCFINKSFLFLIFKIGTFPHIYYVVSICPTYCCVSLCAAFECHCNDATVITVKACLLTTDKQVRALP